MLSPRVQTCGLPDMLYPYGIRSAVGFIRNRSRSLNTPTLPCGVLRQHDVTGGCDARTREYRVAVRAHNRPPAPGPGNARAKVGGCAGDFAYGHYSTSSVPRRCPATASHGHSRLRPAVRTRCSGCSVEMAERLPVRKPESSGDSVQTRCAARGRGNRYQCYLDA